MRLLQITTRPDGAALLGAGVYALGGWHTLFVWVNARLAVTLRLPVRALIHEVDNAIGGR